MSAGLATRGLTFDLTDADADLAVYVLGRLRDAQRAFDAAVAAWNAAAGTTWEPVGDPTPEIADARRERDAELQVLGGILLRGRTGAAAGRMRTSSSARGR